MTSKKLVCDLDEEASVRAHVAHETRKKALIIGLNSQDGYFLCRLLLDKGYDILGTTRTRSKVQSAEFTELTLNDNVEIFELDLLEKTSIDALFSRVVKKLKLDETLEVYCLAAVSQVSRGISQPIQSADTNTLGPIRMLSSIVEHDLTYRVRCFFAASSEIFGNQVNYSPQNEETPCAPATPYGLGKFFMLKHVQFYREYYGIFACSGILYNHESHLRPVSFVTRKVTLTASAISKNLVSYLEIGDLNAERDWGCAKDFVNGMQSMLQHEKAEDFVLCTGKLHSVRELINVAFSAAHIELRWEGDGANEVGINIVNGQIVVRVNPIFYSPNEERYRELTKVSHLSKKIVGDCTKATTKLNWRREFTFEDTIRSMVMHDLSLSDHDILTELGHEPRDCLKSTALRSLLPQKNNSKTKASTNTNPSVSFEPGRLLEGVLSKNSEYVYIIAEIGINHEGSLQTALELVDAAKSAGVDAVKFQKRHLPSIYDTSTIDDPNSQEWNIEYLIETLKIVELSEEDFGVIKVHCDRLCLDLIITPFDEVSADFVHKLGVVAFKNASCNMLNFKLIDKMATKGIPILISTGMWLDDEIQQAVAYLDKKKAKYSLLLSNSTYPCPYEDISLSYLSKLSEYTPVIGYSGHERGTFIPIAAVAMGARIIEKHITFDKNKAGLDHKASMEPDEWREMVKQIRILQSSMGKTKVANQAELLARQSFCLSPYAKKELKKGELLSEDVFVWRAPGKGIFQHEISEYIGKPTAMNIIRGECLSKSHFDMHTVAISEWKIPRYRKKWGVKCRFHDFLEYSILSAPVVEFHCSQKDIYDSVSGICSNTSQLIVHAPEIVDMMLVDICSQDERQRTLSLNILQDTITKTIELSYGFPGKPKLVVHFGGMQLDPAQDEKSLRISLLARAISSFERLKYDSNAIEILPENLPPKPWYLGGEWNQYGFMTEDDMIEFCQYFGLKMTLDMCHAQLYCKSCDKNLAMYTRKVKPYISHLHISDATGVGGEGVQIHEGEIDFDSALNELEDCDCSWVTEIWAGHTNNGQGVYKSMLELQKYEHLL